jgi:hypothetical protein
MLHGDYDCKVSVEKTVLVMSLRRFDVETN